MTSERCDCELCLKSCTQTQLATCIFCEYNVCKTCCHRWLLASNEDAACMNCRRGWTHATMCQLFGKSFVDGAWKRHRRDVLFDREVAMLQETQPYVDQEMQRRENKKRAAELEAERLDLKRKARELEGLIATIESTRVPLEVPSERRNSVQRCARNACDGFVNQNWKCRKCSAVTCRDCGALKTPPVAEGQEENDAPSTADGGAAQHVCIEADKASMELIRKDSRQCVACGAWTFRIHGCNQMFCVSCHTAWDWRTGRRVTGAIHNPEYFRMRRDANNGTLNRDLNDVPCGGTPSLQDINHAWPQPNDPRLHKSIGLLRLVIHIREEEIPLFPAHTMPQENRDLRVKYMLSEASAEELRTKLQQREKKNCKGREVHDVLNMFVVTTSDLLRQMVLEPGSFETVYRQIQGLIEHFNEAMTAIGRRYACVVPAISSRSSTSAYWRVMRKHATAVRPQTPRYHVAP